MIDRPGFVERLTTAVGRSPVTALLGPRQCGKTTLARIIARDRTGSFFDLESQPDLRRLQNPELALRAERGLVVLDEIQARPELFAVLRVLADRPRSRTRFLVLGSASPDLVKGASETLAGRVEFVELGGFDLRETGSDSWERLWLRGGFPRSFVARTEAESGRWREEFIRTFLERDISQFGLRVPAPALRRFWSVLTHYHAQTWNGSELARAFGVAHTTVRRYLDVLTETYMVRRLPLWRANLAKRQVRSPMVYLRDAGLLHSLLVDLVVVRGSTRLGFEFERTFPLTDRTRAVPLERVWSDVAPLA